MSSPVTVAGGVIGPLGKTSRSRRPAWIDSASATSAGTRCGTTVPLSAMVGASNHTPSSSARSPGSKAGQVEPQGERAAGHDQRGQQGAAAGRRAGRAGGAPVEGRTAEQQQGLDGRGQRVVLPQAEAQPGEMAQ